MIRPTRRLLILATLGLLLSLASLWSPWAGGAVLLVSLGVSVAELIALEVRPPVVVMQTPDRVNVGQVFEARVRLASTRRTFRRRLSLECSEGLDAGMNVLDTRTPGDGQTALAIEVTARRRGTSEVHALVVRAAGPLGLLEVEHRVEVARTIRVSPSLAVVRQLSAPSSTKGGHAGVVPIASTGAGTEFDELRPYIAGMDSRSIDWKSSARHRELRVRRYRQEQNQQLVLMVDNHAFDGTDQAVHTGLALARSALAQGDRVAMQLFGSAPRAWTSFGHGARHLQRLVASLAESAPEHVASNPVHAAHALFARLRRRSLVVMFTDVGDPVRAELVADAVRILHTKHRVIVVALRDLERDEIPKPESLEDVGRALLRRTLEAERERAVKQLRSRGVSVVSTGPRGIAGALERRYRASKRRVG